MFRFFVVFFFWGGGTESLICGWGQPVKEWMKALCTELCPPQQQASSRPAAWSTTTSPRPPPSHFNLLLGRATVNAVAQCQQAESVQRLLELLTFFQSASLARLSLPGEGGWILLFSLCLSPLIRLNVLVLQSPPSLVSRCSQAGAGKHKQRENVHE